MATVLEHLLSQTLPPSKIVVVNDGSTDRTRKILRGFPVTVVDLPYHAESHAGTPQMAVKFNAGFAETSPKDEDYMMILGSDDLLYQQDYMEHVVTRMNKNPRLVVASGQLDDEVTDPSAPRGGGRLIKGWFWREVMHNRYPEGWAWEDYINYKAAELGYETRGYLDIKFRRLREAPRTWRKAFGDGRSMYALGFPWIYAIMRVAYTCMRGLPKSAIAVLLGWATAPFVGVKRLDTAEWVRSHWHLKRLMRKVLYRFTFLAKRIVLALFCPEIDPRESLRYRTDLPFLLRIAVALMRRLRGR